MAIQRDLVPFGRVALTIYRRQRVRMRPLYANSRDWLSDLEQKGDRNLALLIETRFEPEFPMTKSTGTLGSES